MATRRDALALVHLINWVVADALEMAPAVAVAVPGVDLAQPNWVQLHANSSGWAGLALVVGEEDQAETSAERASAVVERVSLQAGADWWGADQRVAAGRLRFRAFQAGEYRGEVALGAWDPGLSLPCLAALAAGVRLGLAAGLVVDRLDACPAVPRRFEPRGSYRGATLVDDDALGVGGVAGSLALARAAFGRRSIRAVFLSHAIPPGSGEEPAISGAMTAPAAPVAADFGEADHLILVVGDASGSEPARLLAATLRSSGASVVLCSSLGGAIRELDRTLGPGDVILTLGADAVGMIADALLRRLARDRHG